MDIVCFPLFIIINKKTLDPRPRGDDELCHIVTPAEAGGKHPFRA